MDQPFPFGFPIPTAVYLTLYVALWVLHVLFMHYVLAGSACLAAAVLLGREGGASKIANPLADTLRDWMPFMLSAAITAGVAPLLFVQILYAKPFYTANLLLFLRWLLILPALVIGFYLLYLQKTKFVAAWPFWARLVVGGGALACFAFTAWSWTENHLLSLDSRAWPEQYVSGSLLYASRETAPRLALWFAAAFPTLGLILAWQRWYAQSSEPGERTAGVRRCSLLAAGGLVATCLLAGLLYFVLDPGVRSVVSGRLALPYVVLAALGAVVQFVAWHMQYRSLRFSTTWLSAASVGLGMTLTGVAVVREARRLADLDISAYFASHKDAWEAGGLPVFLFFLVLNTLLIAACFVIVRRGVQN